MIPAINCDDFACVKERIQQAEMFLRRDDWAHIDVTDGAFTFNKTWNDPEELGAWLGERMDISCQLEVHLMLEEPVQTAKRWLAVGAKRLVVHVETITDGSLHDILDTAKRAGAEVMLSMNPETSPQKIEKFLDKFKYFQVLAVHPGIAGQSFLRLVLEKIKFLRQKFPNATIEVDGGMNPETAKLAKEAGANAVVAASYIFGAKEPKEAYEELRSL